MEFFLKYAKLDRIYYASSYSKGTTNCALSANFLNIALYGNILGAH